MDVEYSTFDQPSVESKKSDRTNKANRIEFATYRQAGDYLILL